MGIERRAHQQHIKHQIAFALRASDPIHQRQRCGDQPKPQQGVHAHFLAVTHRRRQQRQQHAGKERGAAGGQSIHQPDSQPDGSSSGQCTEAAHCEDAVTEQLDPAVQQHEIQRWVHIERGVMPDPAQRIACQQQAGTFITPDRCRRQVIKTHQRCQRHDWPQPVFSCPADHAQAAEPGARCCKGVMRFAHRRDSVGCHRFLCAAGTPQTYGAETCQSL
jgi:hypothetical protein